MGKTAVDPTTDPAGDTRLIKRYANRKLYDTRDSRYVTLQQIAEFVRKGEDVKIIDNRTKEDLTNVTLAQIIYEEEKKGESAARKSSLRSFIQEGRARLIHTLPGPLSKLLGDDPEAKETIDDLSKIGDERVRAVLSATIEQVHTLQREVQRLRDRVLELESDRQGD